MSACLSNSFWDTRSWEIYAAQASLDRATFSNFRHRPGQAVSSAAVAPSQTSVFKHLLHIFVPTSLTQQNHQESPNSRVSFCAASASVQIWETKLICPGEILSLQALLHNTFFGTPSLSLAWLPLLCNTWHRTIPLPAWLWIFCKKSLFTGSSFSIVTVPDR